MPSSGPLAHLSGPKDHPAIRAANGGASSAEHRQVASEWQGRQTGSPARARRGLGPIADAAGPGLDSLRPTSEGALWGRLRSAAGALSRRRPKKLQERVPPGLGGTRSSLRDFNRDSCGRVGGNDARPATPRRARGRLGHQRSESRPWPGHPKNSGRRRSGRTKTPKLQVAAGDDVLLRIFAMSAGSCPIVSSATRALKNTSAELELHAAESSESATLEARPRSQVICLSYEDLSHIGHAALRLGPAACYT